MNADDFIQGIARYFFNMNGFGPALLIVGILLSVWLWYLAIKPRQQSHYYAFLIATIYPMLLGILGASISGVRIYLITSLPVHRNGGLMPLVPMLAVSLGHFLLSLLCGLAISGLFLSLGLIILLTRRQF